MTSVLTVIKFRRGSAEEWADVNPTLGAGEPGYETDTGLMKIGDGSLTWVSLPYTNQSVSSGSGQVHNQTTPSGTWVISGTLGRIPNVAVYVDGELVEADVSATPTTVTIVFPSPTAGVAVLS